MEIAQCFLFCFSLPLQWSRVEKGLENLKPNYRGVDQEGPMSFDVKSEKICLDCGTRLNLNIITWLDLFMWRGTNLSHFFRSLTFSLFKEEGVEKLAVIQS